MKILGICGAGGAGREIAEIAECINEKQRRWSEIVFLEIEEREPINGYRVLNERKAFQNLKNDMEVVVSNGEPAVRRKIYENIVNNEISLATLVHSDVKIPGTTSIGKGVIIGQNVFISCNVKIGDNCFINVSSIIGHDSILGEGGGSIWKCSDKWEL